MMNIFSALSISLHLFSAFSQAKLHRGVFVIEDKEESGEGESIETGWEGGFSWEDNIDRMLEESDEGDTSRKWEDLARSLRRAYKTMKDSK